MVAQCPISGKMTGVKQARLNGFLTIAVLTLFVLYPHPAIPLLLAADFTLRGFSLNLRSPVAWLSARLIAWLRLEETPTEAAPKRFAARLGLAFSLTIAVLITANLQLLSQAVAGVLGVCASLEAFFGLCIGCHIYSWAQRFKGPGKLSSTCQEREI